VFAEVCVEILVTGATGFVGLHLVRALIKRGHHVRMFGRTFGESAQSLLLAGAEGIRADLRDRDAVIAACIGCDAVFHVGALSAPWGKRRDFYDINLGGTQHVIEGCQRAAVGRLIYVSSPSVLSNGRDQELLDDTSPYPTRFVSLYSETKKLAEDAVAQAAQQGLATVTLRPKGIFGPGDTTLLPRLIEAGRRGRLPQIGNGQNRVDLTYVDNVIHALLLALETQQGLGGRYTITNDEHVPIWHLIRQVFAHLGISTQLRQIPVGVALALASAMELASIFTQREPLLTRYTVSVLARTQTHRIDAAKRDLGYQPLVSIEQALERTLAHL
jgi:nucleoside-diphosphate-sugar epimerase